MSSDRNEILIQRCVDNELSAAERRELIQQLDGSDGGWKNLACSFMEEQMFSSAIREESVASASLQRPAVMNSSTVKMAEKPHWFNHPVTSLALSACVAFLGGVLISRGMQQTVEPGVVDRGAFGDSGMLAAGDNVISNAQSSSPEGSRNPLPSGGAAASADLVSDGVYRARVEPYGMPAQETPVYDANDYPSRSASFWQSVSRNSRNHDSEPQTRMRYLSLKGSNGETYVFPVQETLMPVRMQ